MVTGLLQELNDELEDTKDIYKVKKLGEIWKEYISYLNYLCRLFGYVDRSYVEETRKERLEVLGVGRFKDYILTQNRI